MVVVVGMFVAGVVVVVVCLAVVEVVRSGKPEKKLDICSSLFDNN